MDQRVQGSLECLVYLVVGLELCVFLTSLRSPVVGVSLVDLGRAVLVGRSTGGGSLLASASSSFLSKSISIRKSWASHGNERD